MYIAQWEALLKTIFAVLPICEGHFWCTACLYYYYYFGDRPNQSVAMLQPLRQSLFEIQGTI